MIDPEQQKITSILRASKPGTNKRLSGEMAMESETGEELRKLQKKGSGTTTRTILQDITNTNKSLSTGKTESKAKLSQPSIFSQPNSPAPSTTSTSLSSSSSSSSTSVQGTSTTEGIKEEKFEIESSGDDDKTEEDHSLMNDREDDVGHPHSQGILTWHDPLNQYTETIYAELRQNELKYRPRADYMEGVQKDINHTMRGILVDWLVEVGEEYKLSTQTLFLTVRYIDRLLSAVSVHRTKLQLVGITCMLLASKYEEIYPPSVDDFVYISDNTYSREEVLRMETVLLNSLKFALTNSTCWEFARRFSAACGLDKRTTALVMYIVEAFLQEPLYLKFLPSQVGAAAVFLALFTTRQKPWTKTLERASRYALSDIKEAISALHQTMLRLYQGHCTLKAVKNKYSEPKLYRVALIVPPTDLT